MELQEVIIAAFKIVAGAIVLALIGIILGLLYKGIDRKISAHMQGRIGPPVRQPFRDIAKLFTKENIVPDNAIPWVFNLAPLVGLVATITILLYLPIGGFPPLASNYGDLILILYLLIIPSLALVVGGFASGSPYATVGAQREMVTMMAYEFPLAIIIVTIAWLINTNNINTTGFMGAFTISAVISTPVWSMVGILGFIGLILLLLTLVIVTPAELSKIPFDAPEAETEIAGGLLTEYSGRNLGMFYLTDAVKTVVMASIIVTLFFPYNLSPFLSLQGSYTGYIIDVIFYLVKIFLVILFSVTLIRVAIARLKIDQIVYTYWVWLTLLALVGLILVMWDQQAILSNWEWLAGYNPLVQMLGVI
ncbi:MAG: NADH-quinone oxidoreductase subunit H [Thermoplasmata archaeon]|nr:MAG: NADH-quinone oxidoreductase subunit H [Thermoplasmata archaeon]